VNGDPNCTKIISATLSGFEPTDDNGTLFEAIEAQINTLSNLTAGTTPTTD
jgi:hypothetical protein